RNSPHPEAAVRQIMVVKHALYRVQVEIRRQIHHRTVFLVKSASSCGAIAVAAHQAIEHPPMRRHVALEIHAQKTGELQESWINATESPGITPGNCRNHGTLEPVERMRLGETIDVGRVRPRVDRAA